MAAANFPSPAVDGQIHQHGAISYQFKAGVGWLNIGNGGSVMDVFSHTATGAEGTSLTVPGGYLANLAVVSRGGAPQAPGDDVNVASGTVIGFATPLVAGESILVYKFRAFSLMDALTKSQSGADIPDKPAFRANIGIAASPYKNLLINALGTVNQRAYVSGAAVGAANTYTLDRWKVVVSGQALSWSESQNIRTMTAPAGGVEQAVEGLNIQSGAHRLSWAGTATATVDGVAVANGGSVTLVGGANAVVRFAGGAFALPQLEHCGVVTEFGAVPYDVELHRCQRYYETGRAYLYVGASGGVGQLTYAFLFKATKRTAPAFTGLTGGVGVLASSVEGVTFNVNSALLDTPWNASAEI